MSESAASPRPWCECDPDYDGRCPYPCQIDADEKREAASAASAASSRASAEQIVEASSAATPSPRPDFKACGNCGADAASFVTWDNADGWCCSNCGGCDSDE